MKCRHDDDDDDDDDDVEDDADDDEDDEDDENVVFLRRPVIVSQPEHLVVDNGMTISLPCMVDQIPGETRFFHSTRFRLFVSFG